MTSRASDAPETLLAALSLAGASLAERQVELALALGCERIICLASGFEKGVSGLQRRADAAGVKFNAVSGPRALLGLVGATDSLIAIAEGVLADADIAGAALTDGEGVLVLPVEAGLAAGFERIDLNHAWAGILSMQDRKSVV